MSSKRGGQVPGNQQALYIMMPVVSLVADGDITVVIECYSILRKDINEVPITVIVSGVRS